MLCSNCIIDMNARVGRNVSITNTEVSKWGETSFRAEIFFVKKKTLVFFRKKDHQQHCSSMILLASYLLCQGVQEADRPEQGYYIRSGVVVILKNATIKDGTVI
jgi:glucose-1-phosphate adenylyltransferase